MLGAEMEREITIIDRGRGPQLSTSRITIQDLFPYFQLGYSHEQIIREAMPSLTVAEIEVAKRYVDEHLDEVLEEDRLIREYNATRKNPPWVQEVLRQGHLKLMERLEFYRKQRGEASNGEGRSG
jgi:uncharacterized protein (DUF433 family)